MHNLLTHIYHLKTHLGYIVTQLSELGATGEKTRQKTCLLMASAISLQLARECKEEAQQVGTDTYYI